MTAEPKFTLDMSSGTAGLIGRVQDAATQAVTDGCGEAVTAAVGLDKVLAVLGPLIAEWYRTVTREQVLKACAVLGLSAADADATWSLLNMNRTLERCECKDVPAASKGMAS